MKTSEKLREAQDAADAATETSGFTQAYLDLSMSVHRAIPEIKAMEARLAKTEKALRLIKIVAYKEREQHNALPFIYGATLRALAGQPSEGDALEDDHERQMHVGGYVPGCKDCEAT